jgi:hypothetical protein
MSIRLNKYRKISDFLACDADAAAVAAYVPAQAHDDDHDVMPLIFCANLFSLCILIFGPN